jgi:hypothetical protein
MDVITYLHMYVQDIINEERLYQMEYFLNVFIFTYVCYRAACLEKHMKVFVVHPT